MARRKRARSARRTKAKLGTVVAKKTVPRFSAENMEYHSIFLGILVFLVGLLLHYEWKWSAILMLTGVLIFVKGLIAAATNK